MNKLVSFIFVKILCAEKMFSLLKIAGQIDHGFVVKCSCMTRIKMSRSKKENIPKKPPSAAVKSLIILTGSEIDGIIF